MRRRELVALANSSRVRVDGRTLPLSSRATTVWAVPIALATYSWVMSASDSGPTSGAPELWWLFEGETPGGV